MAKRRSKGMQQAEDGRPVALYVRVSTGRQRDEGVSLDNQKRVLHGLAGVHFPESTVEVYEDVSTGRNDRRPAYRTLRDRVRGAKVRAVIAWSHDRLSRSAAEFSSFVDAAQRGGVVVILHATGVVSSTPLGAMFAKLLGIMGEFESAQISVRTRESIAAAESMGRKGPGIRPFGWAVTDDGMLVEDAAEQRVVDVGVAMMSKGRTWREIADVVSRMGVRTVTGVEWNEHVVRRVVLTATARRERAAGRFGSRGSGQDAAGF